MVAARGTRIAVIALTNVLLILLGSLPICCQQTAPTPAPSPAPGPKPPPTPAPAPAPETVVFPDKNLEKVIRTALDKPAEEAIIPAELAGLMVLHARELHINDLSGIEYCTNLSELYLHFNRISDISPLVSLTSLEKLSLYKNQISALSSLASLTNLSELDLDVNQISDISTLASLTNLHILHLARNQISDLSPLLENSGLGEGDKVWLDDNNLDLSEGSEDMENIRILEERGVRIQY